MDTLKNKKDFGEYFVKLGYSYVYQQDITPFGPTKEYYHQLYNKNGQLVFLCSDVPLLVVLNDMCVIEDFHTSYKIDSDDPKLYRKLVIKVRKQTGKVWNTLKERDDDLNKL